MLTSRGFTSIIGTLTDPTLVEDMFLIEPCLGIGPEKGVGSASFFRYFGLGKQDPSFMSSISVLYSS